MVPSILAIAHNFSYISTSSVADRNIIHNNNITRQYRLLPSMDQPLQQHRKKVANVRLVLEQIKFVLRMYLLASYWKQQQQRSDGASNNNYYQRSTSPNHINTTTQPITMGILMNGGLYETCTLQAIHDLTLRLGQFILILVLLLLLFTFSAILHHNLSAHNSQGVTYLLKDSVWKRSSLC
jgi:hypothetical protein